MAWAATTLQNSQANLGDALSPVLVSALSGLPTIHANFKSNQNRMAAIGTIAQDCVGGTIHFWGTGLNPNRSLGKKRRYRVPAGTTIKVHAMRGPLSSDVLQRQGIEVSGIYGDPVWFLPAIIPAAPEKRYELGVIPHFFELPDPSQASGAWMERYQVPRAMRDDVKRISTLTTPTFEGLEALIRQITACKRIVSNSLHGMVIAEAYGIPCLHFAHGTNEAGQVTRMPMTLANEAVNYRIRDFYGGVGVQRRFVYQQNRYQRTRWRSLIKAIDQRWEPIEWKGDAFLEAFPLPLTFNPLAGVPFEQRSRFTHIRF